MRTTLRFLMRNSVTLVFMMIVVAISHTQIAQAVDSVIDGNIVFTGPSQGGAKDIRTSTTNGGLRMYNGQTLSAIPEGAAIQFFGNGSASFPGQAFIDSGAHNNAALIFRTAGTGGAISERMRVTATGNVGIGTTNPQEQLQITGNLRLPTTTTTSGVIRSGTDTLLHGFGTNNFFAGSRAGNLTMTGQNNTGNGFQALLNNTTGSGNTASGSQAMGGNTTGDNNTATGFQALVNNTTGIQNTASGVNALAGNLTGDSNTAAGFQALVNNTTGTNNIAGGFNALVNNTTGGNNVAIGGSAGNNNSTGSNNTFVGGGSNAGSVNLTNATAIGANALVGSSNTLVLGGTDANAVSVGIGTTAPISTLQVVGNFVQIPKTATFPLATDCDHTSEVGRMVVLTGNGQATLMVCVEGLSPFWLQLGLPII